MSIVDDAFEDMRQRAEVKPTELAVVQRRHHRIRAVLEGVWDLDRTFLTGSYDRHTKIRPLEDVDIFAVVDPDGAQAGLRDEPPAAIIAALVADLDGRFRSVDSDGMAVQVSMSDDDGQARFEIVPAFSHPVAGFEAPDPDRGSWIRTDPDAHAVLTAGKNSACGQKWVPFVKMAKGWNAENGRPVGQSFLIEVMALELVRSPFGRYQDELTMFFANVARRIDGPWADPADVGPDVDELLTPADRDRIRNAANQAQEIAEEAVFLEDEGEDRKAVVRWRDLFGNRMPSP